MRLWSLALAGALLSTQLPAQATCPAAATADSYRVVVIPNAFSTITTDPAATNVYDATVGSFTNVYTAPIALPAPFTFFGMAKTQYVVSTNGFLTFTSNPGQVSSQNAHPGDFNQPNDFVAPFWDEHIGTAATTPAGSIWSLYPAADGSLTVEWNNMQLLVDGTALTGIGSYSFQAKLFSSTHATKPNQIEFHYDPASVPTPQTPCPSLTGWYSMFAMSATVGLENAFGTVGVDATERGAGTPTLPKVGYRFLAASYKTRDLAAGAFYTVTSGPAPFCHIEGLPGTTEFTNPITGLPSCASCVDDNGSARLAGQLFDLPWKFVLYGRPYRTADVSPNGHIDLGPGVFDITGSAMFGPSEVDAAIAPLWGDWEGITPSDLCGAAQTSMFWRVDGVPGARVLTVEWHDMHNADGAAGDCLAGANHCSFQARLFEGSAGAYTCSPAGCPGPGTTTGVGLGVGDDLIQFQWDSPCGLSAPSGIENWRGTSTNSATPSPGGSVTFNPCDEGTTRFYGNANVTPGSPPGVLCVPEITGNGVPPLLGNPFGLAIVGATPGAAGFLLIDGSAPIAGTSLPVPPGGLPLPFGTLWVPFPSTVLIAAGAVAGSGPCAGSLNASLPIPVTPALVGGVVYAQFISVVVPVLPFGIGLEATEGAKIRIGP